MKIRKDVVSGQFYPANQKEIKEMFAVFNKILDKAKFDKYIIKAKPRAIIVPHAGYIYSGFTANIAFSLLKDRDISRVVVIGPSHHVAFNGSSVGLYDSFQTPLGSLPIDKEFTSELITKFNLTFNPDAHLEHSTEVQMPFIKTYLKSVSVVEIVYSQEDSKKMAKIIDFILQDLKTLVVVSTDLSHYFDIKKANTLDKICIDAIKALDTSKLYQGCEACGKIGVEAMLMVANNQHLIPNILDYRTSADASGDESAVVGYVSAIFTKA